MNLCNTLFNKDPFTFYFLAASQLLMCLAVVRVQALLYFSSLKRFIFNLHLVLFTFYMTLTFLSKFNINSWSIFYNT